MNTFKAPRRLTRPFRHVEAIVAYALAPALLSAASISHDALNRIATVLEGANATRTFQYDPSGNRTNTSVTLGFSVSSLANQQVAANATLALPLATAGSLLTESAGWTIRPSNYQLVPKSGIQVLGAGTASPSVEITPASGEVGTTRITVIASDGNVAAATSFVLIVGDNRPPLAINDSAQHPLGEGTKIESIKLLDNDSDPDHDPLILSALGTTSAHGGSVAFFGPFITYDPPSGYDGPDFFIYSISDSHGATASAAVNLKSQPVASAVPITVINTQLLENGHRLVTFIGVPNITYIIQVSADLMGWTDIGVSTANDRGVYVFDDVDASLHPVRFYRSIFR